MKISVIIPTYRDWPRLLLCLNALTKQTLPRDDFEIIVVDNDPAGHAPPVLPTGVRCIHQAQGYSYAARNAGARLAQGEVLAFTDADCLPQPDWLAMGLAALEAHPEWGLVAGRIEVFTDTENLVSRYENLFEFQQQAWVQTMHFGATANLLVHRLTLESVRGFDEAMKSGGDSDFGRRCKAQGWLIGYSDAACVLHPSRHTVDAVLSKNRRIAAGFYSHALRDNGGRHEGLWRQLPFWWRLRPIAWLHILTGQRGSNRYAFRHRWGVLWLHMLLHYHTAWCMLRSCLTHEKANHAVR